MENNENGLLNIIYLINGLQKNAITDTNSGCTKPVLGTNNNTIYNTRPISMYLCNNSPLTITYETGESSVFRIENINGNCVTVRLLATNENNEYVSTNEFATISMNCIAAIRCYSDISLSL